MRTKIHSFSALPHFDAELEHLQGQLGGISKSEAIRQAVKHAINTNIEKGNTMNPAMDHNIAKAEQICGNFFNEAIHREAKFFNVVRNQANELIKAYSETRFPQLTPEQAVAKTSFSDDPVMKTLYLLASLQSAEQFDTLKAQLRANGGDV